MTNSTPSPVLWSRLALARSMGGRVPRKLAGSVRSISIDTRTLEPGALYFAIKGDVHDGQFGARCEQCHVTESWNKLPLRSGLKPTGNTGVSR